MGRRHRGGLSVLEAFFSESTIEVKGKTFVEGEISTGEGGMKFLYFDKFDKPKKASVSKFRKL